MYHSLWWLYKAQKIDRPLSWLTFPALGLFFKKKKIFYYSLFLDSPFLTWIYWVVCELWCGKWAMSSPEVYRNLTRRVSQHHTKGEKSITLTLPPFPSRPLMVSSPSLLSCDLCLGHWENKRGSMWPQSWLTKLMASFLKTGIYLLLFH